MPLAGSAFAPLSGRRLTADPTLPGQTLREGNCLSRFGIPEKPFKKDKKIDKNILFFNKFLYICRNKT